MVRCSFDRNRGRAFWTPAALDAFPCARILAVLLIAVATRPARAAEADIAASFRKSALPVLNKFCAGCHNADLKKGGIDFDQDDPTQMLGDTELWQRTLKMLQAGLMPPKGKRRPSAEQLDQVEKWIKYSAFDLWYVQQFSRLLDKLNQVRDEDGSSGPSAD
jgi:mono/diheme cytochrome c family protein